MCRHLSRKKSFARWLRPGRRATQFGRLQRISGVWGNCVAKPHEERGRVLMPAEKVNAVWRMKRTRRLLTGEELGCKQETSSTTW